MVAVALAALALMRQVGVLTVLIHQGHEDGPRIGTEAPAFAGRAIGSGRLVSKSDLKGRRAVVAFMAAECEGCRDLIGPLNELAAANGRGAAVLVVAGGDASMARKLMDEQGLGVPTVPDSEAEAFGLYGVRNTPLLVLLDERGVVVGKGPANDRDQLRQLLAETYGPVSSEPAAE